MLAGIILGLLIILIPVGLLVAWIYDLIWSARFRRRLAQGKVVPNPYPMARPRDLQIDAIITVPPVWPTA